MISQSNLKTRVALGLWACMVVLIGAILTSYHQPFRLPGNEILKLVDGTRAHAETNAGTGSQWKFVHVLAESCGCSQRVMKHLLARGRMTGAEEQIILVSGLEAGRPDASGSGSYLPEGHALLAALEQNGFPVRRVAIRDVPQQAGLRGVPLLIITDPSGSVAYIGGYGSRNDQDAQIFQSIRSGRRPAALPLLGCAVGARLQQASDPFHLKY